MQSIYVISAVTENTIRVLQRMTGVFARHRINIEQLTVFESSNKGTSLCNVVIHCDSQKIERVIKQLQRIVELSTVSLSSPIPLVYSPSLDVAV